MMASEEEPWWRRRRISKHKVLLVVLAMFILTVYISQFVTYVIFHYDLTKMEGTEFMTFDGFPKPVVFKVPEMHRKVWIPQIQNSGKPIDFVILILSARMNFKLRDAVRHAIWATSAIVDSSVVIRFVVGKHRNQTELPEETDLLEVDVTDSYASLPAKIKLGYRWAFQEFPTLKWVLKVDDDCIIWPNRLVQFLKTLDSSQMTIIGKIGKDEPVRKTGKWKELNYNKSSTYPMFPLGSYGHIISNPIAKYISNRSSEELFEYQGEDTSLGIWVENLNVRFIHVPTLMRNDRYCIGQAMVVGHDMKSLADMKECLQPTHWWW